MNLTFLELLKTSKILSKTTNNIPKSIQTYKKCLSILEKKFHILKIISSTTFFKYKSLITHELAILLLSQKQKSYIRNSVKKGQVGRGGGSRREEFVKRVYESIEYFKESIKCDEEIDDNESKMITMIEIGKNYMKIGEYQLSMNIYEKVRKKVDRDDGNGNSYYYEKSIVLHEMGCCNMLQGKMKKAKEVFEECLKVQIIVRNIEGKANTLHELGRVYFEMSDYKKTIECFEECLKIFQQIQNCKGEAHTLHSIGIVHTEKSEFKKALKYFEDSKLLFERINDVNGIASSIHAKGHIFHQASLEYEKALKYFNKALRMFEISNNIRGKASTLHEIGLIKFRKKHYPEAIEYFQKSLELDKSIKNIFDISTTFHSIGLLLQETLQYQKSIEYYKKSIKIYEKTGNLSSKAVSCYNLGWSLYKMKLYNESKSYFLESFNIWKTIKLKFEECQKSNELLETIESEIEKKSYSQIKKVLKNKRFADFNIMDRIGKKESSYTYYDEEFEREEKRKDRNGLFFGASAAVFLCHLKNEPLKLPFAMKICFNLGYDNFTEIYYEFIKKHQIKMIKHENTMNVLHYFIDDVNFQKLPKSEEIDTNFIIKKSAILIFPFCEMNLKQRIINEDVFSEFIFLKYAKGLLEGLCEIHRNNIVHRDLKPDNILVSTRDNVIITDFELHIRFKKEDNYKIKYSNEWLSRGGAVSYLPPEILNQKRGYFLDYSKSDIFSVGMISYEVLSKRIKIRNEKNDFIFIKPDPFQGKDPKSRKECDYVEINRKDISKEVKNLVKKMINPNILNRIKCYDALKIVTELFDESVREKISIKRKLFNLN